MNTLYFCMVAFLIITFPVTFADEDESEEKHEDREGFGVMEQESEHDDEVIAIGNDTDNLILYVTLGAIVASIGYTAFKILKTKQPVVSRY